MNIYSTNRTNSESNDMNATELFTTKRTGSNTRIFWDGQQVGEAFKFTQATGYGLRLHGVYWRKGEPSTCGGSSTSGHKLKRDAIARAKSYLESNAGIPSA